MYTMKLNDVFNAPWYKGEEGVPGCVINSELRNILEKFQEIGEGARQLTILPVQGVVLNNLTVMMDEDKPDDYILMWPSMDVEIE